MQRAKANVSVHKDSEDMWVLSRFFYAVPVLFYIHGGGMYNFIVSFIISLNVTIPGYEYGNPANWPFEHWINQSPNVVIVSVYYRLDSFGFLSHPQFSTDPLLGDHNVGFQDQQLALKWVQENIAAFGGDPGKVTINGQSAGGGSVEMHMIANGETEGTFRGAIGQSVFRVVMPTPEQQEVLSQIQNIPRQWWSDDHDDIAVV